MSSTARTPESAPRDRQRRGLAWREAGDGPPLVLLHGLGGTRESWGPQLRGLSDRFRCIAWDMPGYGGSSPLTPLCLQGIADRLIALLDLLDIERAHLVGLSFGGMHALHAALRHPRRVHRLVLAGTSAAFGANGTSRDDWIRSRLDPLKADRRLRDRAEAIIDSITATRLGGRVRAEVLAAFDRIPEEGFRAAVLCLPGHDVRAELHRVASPTRVIVGELDAETPVCYARALAAGIADSDLRVLEGVGHLSPSEAPQRFNDLVADFLG